MLITFRGQTFFEWNDRYFLNRRAICQACKSKIPSNSRKSSKDKGGNAISIATETRVSTTDTGTSTHTKSRANGSPPSTSPTHEELHKVLFFPDTSLVTPTVREGGGFNAIQGEYPYSADAFKSRPNDGPFDQLLNLVRTTKSSLDLCIYVLSFPPLAEAILELFERAVNVRIIVDGREDEAMRSQVARLSRRGIPIRCNEKSYSILMHNKFAIIDSKIVLTGSLNWTKSAVLLNYDNVLITSTTVLVDSYREQFNKLWSRFKPYTTSSSSGITSR